MRLSIVLPLLAAALHAEANHPTTSNVIEAEPHSKGYPVFFGSFGDVGESEITGDLKPVSYVDNKVTEWTRGCPADAFVLIRDSAPFQLGGFIKMQRLAENSLTRGSFLTESMLNANELALDLEDYCDGQVFRVNRSTDLDALPKPLDTQVRVFYLDFDHHASAEWKDEVMTAVMMRISSPFVTIVYTSTFQQSRPILRSLQLSPKRTSWQRSKLKHNPEQIAPIIAPLLGSQSDKTGHAAPDPEVELPDHFFLTLMCGSLGLVAFLTFKDLKRWRSKPKV